MSRLAIHPITLPHSVEVVADGCIVFVKGPKGSLSKTLHPDIGFVIDTENHTVQVEKKKETKFSQAMWGTSASHLRNMIHGVVEGYEKKLIIEGVGYKVEMQGNMLSLRVGFSHPVDIKIPEGLDVEIVKNTITIKGIDKELVTSFAAKVRLVKKTEPYKGKGIRYDGEVVRRKSGKSK